MVFFKKSEAVNLFSDVLRDLRNEKGCTQTEVARACGVSTQCISSLEMGTRNPTGSTLTSLADFFGVSTDYLLGREDLGYVTVQSSPAIPRLTESERYLLEWFRALPSEEARRSFLSFIQSDKKSATKRN